MAFADLENAIENHRVVRRLSAAYMQPLQLDVLPADHVDIVDRVNKLRQIANSFTDFMKQPTGKYQLRVYLRSLGGNEELLMDLLDAVDAFATVEPQDRRDEARRLYAHFFEAAPGGGDDAAAVAAAGAARGSSTNASRGGARVSASQPQQKQPQPTPPGAASSASLVVPRAADSPVAVRAQSDDEPGPADPQSEPSHAVHGSRHRESVADGSRRGHAPTLPQRHDSVTPPGGGNAAEPAAGAGAGAGTAAHKLNAPDEKERPVMVAQASSKRTSNAALKTPRRAGPPLAPPAELLELTLRRIARGSASNLTDVSEADARGAAVAAGAGGAPSEPTRLPSDEQVLSESKVDSSSGHGTPVPLPEAGDPGPDVFAPVVDWVRRRLEREHFPAFLSSPFFVEYVQYREYCSRGNVSLDSFQVYRRIGCGSFGIVSPVSKKDTYAVYAMKEMDKRQIKAEKVFNVALNERQILAELRSPFVTHLKYCFQTEDTIMFVMDFCQGGDLRWHLKNTAIVDSANSEPHFPVERARFYAAEVLLALEHLHSLRIVYRDMKPQNILMDASGHVRLSDFGLAQKLSGNKMPTSLTGTPGYWAPEVMMRVPHGLPADVWSWGVTLHYFLAGHRPKTNCPRDKWSTFGRDDHETEALAYNTKLDGFHSEVILFHGLDPDAKDLLRRIFVLPEKRITIPQIKAHPFFSQVNWTKLHAKRVEPPYVPNTDDLNADHMEALRMIDLEKYRKVAITPEEQQEFQSFNYYNERIMQQELVDALEKQYRRFGSHPQLAFEQEQARNREAEEGCCCSIG